MNKLVDFKSTKVHYQLPVEELIQQTLDCKAGVLNDTGALVISTGKFTGRSPLDKFIVKDINTENTVDWNKFNQPFSAACFSKLKTDMISYLDRQPSVWIRDAYACADAAFRLKIRVINEEPWCSHFVANMFLAPDAPQIEGFDPDWTVIQAPGFKAIPSEHGTRQRNFTVVSFSEQTILIGGSGYTGEIKKGIFTVLNYILPLKSKVLSMHCSANEGTEGDVALFFGLSGTGKTTLSADPERILIGDDEHGWSESGIFNIEGGCYAKIINLSKEYEPDIYGAIREGALVENACFLPDSNRLDYNCASITENTRASYPLALIPRSKHLSLSGVPRNIFFLTCDAYGVFPPVSKLSNKQAMYYFINGYTAKIAGTEEGIKEPQVTFSACFGAPFLPLAAEHYAGLLNEKLKKNNTNVWLINTGWTGGAYGTGKRISIAYTRAIIAAALSGCLAEAVYLTHPVFGINIPQNCPDVPIEILNPWESWDSWSDYEAIAQKLLEQFKQNEKMHLLSV